ncbi:E3 ubiquitin-protein ligase TRIM39-like isoform X2 [Engraulis encrasicolus]|uniref:E3 ubiquitin-protein ligase TRIM39-like isoform X2 n=1 Tax=Engraulis encrasicolus TaxID=184585 RepID=UPI002FD198B4
MLKVKHVSPCAAQNTWSMDKSIKFAPHSPLPPAKSTSPLNTQQDVLRCPVCAGVLKDPASIPCGHTYCRQCITSFWAQPNQAGYYTCPTCRKRFRTRPDLNSKAPIPQQSQRVCASSANGPTPCDFCLTQKGSAVKFCVTCMASYCETHVRQHYTVPVLQTHRLVEAVPLHLEQVICLRHSRALEMFCRTDGVSVCSLCAVLEHRHHDVLVDIPKQTKTSNCPRPGAPMVRGRQTPTVDAEMENRELRMKNKLQQEVILQHRKVEVHQKSREVKRDKRHKEEIQQIAQSISGLETCNAKLKRHNKSLMKKLAKLNKSSHQPSSDHHPIVPVANHCKRHPLPARVVLDLATAHRRLMLSEDKRSVKLARCPRTSWNRQQGLDGRPFVLGMRGFSSGRRFWQVGVNNRWIIGVARASAQRTGNVTFYPSHGYWCLSRSMQFSALTTPPLKCLPESSVPRELGVCLDVDERWVSFYNAQSKAHIYTFTNMEFGDGEEIYPFFSTHDEEQEIKIRKQPMPHCPVFVSDQITVLTEAVTSPDYDE